MHNGSRATQRVAPTSPSGRIPDCRGDPVGRPGSTRHPDESTGHTGREPHGTADGNGVHDGSRATQRVAPTLPSWRIPDCRGDSVGRPGSTRYPGESTGHVGRAPHGTVDGNGVHDRNRATQRVAPTAGRFLHFPFMHKCAMVFMCIQKGGLPCHD